MRNLSPFSFSSLLRLSQYIDIPHLATKEMQNTPIDCEVAKVDFQLQINKQIGNLDK